MAEEDVAAREGLVALVAAVRLLPAVQLLVAPQAVLAAKGLGAQRAGVAAAPREVRQRPGAGPAGLEVRALPRDRIQGRERRDDAFRAVLRRQEGRERAGSGFPRGGNHWGLVVGLALRAASAEESISSRLRAGTGGLWLGSGR